MNIYYRGNKNLTKCGVLTPNELFDKEKLKEIKKCRDDIVYFAEKYVYTVDPYVGQKLVELYDDQKKDLISIDIDSDRVTSLLGRRMTGLSTTLVIKNLHTIIFHSDIDCAIVSDRERHSRGLLGRIKLAYELLPMWLKHGVSVWNKSWITLENGSSIITSSANSRNLGGRTWYMMSIDNALYCDLSDISLNLIPSIVSTKEGRVALYSTY